MKRPRGARAILAVSLCVLGFVLARATPYREATAYVGAGECRLTTDILDNGQNQAQGYVILLHGLSANKKIMAYIARGFAAQNLRVFVPDLPGHGHTPGPFSPERAESCTESFVKLLIARRAIDPALTILAGHSMGGAIAIRVAAKIPVAGVIAFSPAPMAAAHGSSAELLLYTNPPPLPPHTLVISGSFEPDSMRRPAAALLNSTADSTSSYLLIAHATHVSLLFDPRTLHAAQDWAARILTLPTPANAQFPPRYPFVGAILGFIGMLLLAGPFLRETVGKIPHGRVSKSSAPSQPSRAAAPKIAASDPLSSAPDSPYSPPLEPLPSAFLPLPRVFLEVVVVSLACVFLLKFFDPLRALRLYEGSYFVSFLFIAGIALLLLHFKSALHIIRTNITRTGIGAVIAAAFAALIFQLLFSAWLDLTLTEAWLTPERWLRFPFLALAALPYHLAEELLLGPARIRSPRLRLALALILRLLNWGALVFAIFFLHSTAVLLVLLFAYLALFSILQRHGMDIVRYETSSPLAAALFGAILLSGFCLVIFPII